MISKEDIKRIKETDFDELRKESPKKWWTEKDATHKNTPLTNTLKNTIFEEKNASHRNTHHTRHGGRTDHSTSSHGLSPSRTDRVMRVLRDVCVILWGYMGLMADYLIKEVKIIKGVVKHDN